jgi:hypothetical protein
MLMVDIEIRFKIFDKQKIGNRTILRIFILCDMGKYDTRECDSDEMSFRGNVYSGKWSAGNWSYGESYPIQKKFINKYKE